MYAKSNPSDARANNRRLLFRLLFPDRQLSRADLCKETGLSRATATDVTGEMIDDGLLRELGSGNGMAVASRAPCWPSIRMCFV